MSCQFVLVEGDINFIDLCRNTSRLDPPELNSSKEDEVGRLRQVGNWPGH